MKTISIMTIISNLFATLAAISSVISCSIAYKTIKSQQQKQAKQINSFVTTDNILIIKNTSDYPIYDVFIFTVKNNTLSSKKDLKTLNLKNNLNHYDNISSQENKKIVVSSPERGVGSYPISVIIFQDIYEKYWIKTQNGLTFNITKKQKQKLLLKNKIFPPYPH